MGAILDRISWGMVGIMCALLGLAPFVPAPHIWQKLQMLVAGNLTQMIDIGDLLMHGAPWLVLIAKLIRVNVSTSGSQKE
ncbi:MAG: RND transporter [Rhodobacteraceae bacterium]|nr:RND transporter [Paracoccaceae bacterium]